jgi:hypothetical protein
MRGCLMCEGNLSDWCWGSLSLCHQPRVDAMLEALTSAIIGNWLTIQQAKLVLQD